MRPGCWQQQARLDDMDLNHVEAAMCFPMFPRFCGQTFIEASFDEVRPGAYDPEKFIADNRTDGVAASVIYPSEALLAYSIPDSQLCSTTMAAYNDFIAEFCAHDPERLKGIALINVDDVDEAIAEMTRSRDMGLAGATITVMPPSGQGYDHPRYEPFWSAAVDLDVPLSMHVATGRALTSAGGQGKNDIRAVSETAFYLQDHFVRKSLGEMIFAGVFERHPKLRVGSVEHEVGRIPFWLFQMDCCYTDRPLRGDWHRFADPDARPSHFLAPTALLASRRMQWA